MHKVDNLKHAEKENKMANSFASLKNSRKTALQKLQSEVEKINNPQNNFSREDDRFGRRNSTSLAVVMLSFVSFLLQTVRNYSGQKYSITGSKDPAVGISRTL